ncbi:MAG: pyridoxamine 5'-phosphate oxidase family protein [Deltaproteobacteria bacterium HGW-Deltaproteobacteria-10]|nr:MAG: pyridoxamine 5'-phosphate oxidase family protein [Deltaproteobacteria bacterium HGW-Deltaproteobacteria-10]
MRRSDKEIKDSGEIAAIMAQAAVCRIALIDDDYPYIVPVNFAVRNNYLYFHSSPQGRKIDILRKNNRVCFEIDSDVEIVPGDVPCAWGTRYRSVIGFGRALVLEKTQEKKQALDYLMEKYSDRKDFSYATEALENVAVFRIKIEMITGKKSGYK